MKFATQVRRYFKYHTDGLKLEGDGVHTGTDGLAYFLRFNENGESKKTFKNIKECEDWISENVDDRIKSFSPGKRIDKFFSGVQSKGLEITDEEWSTIQGFMNTPGNFKKEDIRIYEDWLANNIRDRQKERFSFKVLDKLNKTIVGKQRLIAHAWGAPGKGKYYQSRIEELSADEFMKLIPQHPDKDIREHLDHVLQRDGKLAFMVPRFYIRVKGNETQIDDFDAGIGGDSSIGFRADSIQSVKDEDNNVLYYEYLDFGVATEALEGSAVWLGAQYGAGIKKTAEDEPEGEYVEIEDVKNSEGFHVYEIEKIEKFNKIKEQKTECDGKGYSIFRGRDENGEWKDILMKFDFKLWTPDEAMKFSINAGEFSAFKEKPVANKKGDTMKFSLKVLEFEKDVELDGEDSVVTELQTDVVKAVDDYINPIIEERDTLKTELDTTKATLADSEVMIEAGKKYKTSLIDSISQLKVLLSMCEKEEEKIEADKKVLETLTIEQLETQKDQFQKKYDKEFPPKGQSEGDAEGDGDDKPKKLENPNPKSSFELS